jgi:cytochrome c-type biogenesis protein CcmH/NrfF
MRRVAGRALLALALVVVPAVAGAALAPTQREIEEALTCQCGCGLTVHACNHLQCPSAEPMKAEIAKRLAAGESKETILAAFRTRYGEKVLSSPTFRGFNWFAWVTPFAAVLAGGLAVTVVIRRWVRTTRPAPAADGSRPQPGSTPADDELRRRLARELADFDREA